MNSDQTFNILNQNWSRKSILKRIKRGEDDDLIVYEFVKINKKNLIYLSNYLNKKEPRILDQILKLINCELKLIEQIKRIETSNTKPEVKDHENNHGKNQYLFKTILFLNKWSNKFVICSLLIITLVSLTNQAWA